MSTVEKRRVLMISKACLVGAYQTKLEAIARHSDIDLTVIVPPEWRDRAGTVPLEKVHTTGYRLIVDPIRWNGHFHIHYYPTLKQRLAELRPHIVHLDEEPYNLATWLGWKHSRAIGAKTLFFSWQNLYNHYPFPFNIMEQQVLKGVDYAIMGNAAAAEVWQRKGYLGPYQIIPQFGVSPTLFHPVETPSPERPFTLGVVGRRIVPEKGVDLVLRAAATLPGDWRIRIAGEGPERDHLAQLAQQLGIYERVIFDGLISSIQMPGYLHQMDVVILPSRTLPNWKEQFGRVIQEAMACGVPVIGSDSGEIPHVIGEAGLIFPEDSAPHLRAHLLALLTDSSLRQQLKTRGRERVLHHYTQDQIATKTVQVYRFLKPNTTSGKP
ncbi:MAG: glycosyltransferase family 4 protein [Chloroflexi bacterium]|nr:glycosyltransferase family 4 protein [Chloroflexota bacterium]MBP8058203.1 glycosyltransferase family 4 protein [Chloroflexota bacterium]